MVPDWFHDLIESADAALAVGLGGAGLLVVLALALLLGLRHATDPDHLAAMGTLVAASGREPRAAARLGAWWGAGHAATLLAVGLPLVVLQRELPDGLQHRLEQLVGVAIVLLGVQALLGALARRTRAPRSPLQAAGVGVLHGLGGTGAVVVLLLAQLEPQQAALALAVFAPATALSMALCSGVAGWALSRPALATATERVVVPVLGVLAIAFGLGYAGVG
ncbi:HupE/UreJ family protein [Conexibacter sp. SYSU D00693]|uniref:HupE/UreJ family protein n=1 Tax=Conexibacter sp. SYSU D00693 TaxID=2812560 RepID=UPI00196AD603|nr:HupE/UreJ family protein [Conexibacter sp. SYSU D00693]